MQTENGGTNFTSQAASDAEKNIAAVISEGNSLGVEQFIIQLETNELISLVAQLAPKRLALVCEKYPYQLAQLNQTELLDKLLGIDATLQINGKHIAVDVTTGKGGVLANKRRKIAELKAIYTLLKLDFFFVIRLRTEFSENLLINLLSQIETIITDPKLSNEFVHVIKL